MLPEQQQRILGYFIEEARDHLNTIEQGLLNLQSTLNDPEMINEVFRAAHSIKGGAAMLGLTSIQHTSHRLEDCFKILKESPIQVDQKLESLFLGVSDTLKALLEQLSGPFGLSEEVANTLMSETEPVFQWLHEHLELLVQKGVAGEASEHPVIQPHPADSVGTFTEIFFRQDGVNTGAEIRTIAPVVPTYSPVSADTQWSEFQAQVLQTLREMLQLFKQPATPASRQNLQDCCNQLVKIGKTANLPNWCNLCKAAANAIANQENSYLTLAKIVITEIKQAQELVLQGREAEITISHRLEALWGFPEMPLLEVAQNLLGDVPIAVTQSLIEPVIPEPKTSNNETSQPVIGTLSDSVTSLTDISEQFDVENTQSTDSLLGNEDHTLHNTSKIHTHGPEVGLAELNTLADLFEGETPELDETWQQEEILNIKDASNLGVDTNESQSEEIDSDLADFLSLDDEEPQNTTSNSEDLSLLFGDNFLEKDNLEAQGLFKAPITAGEILQENREKVSALVDSAEVIDDLLELTFNEDSSTVTTSSIATDNLFLETNTNIDILEDVELPNNSESQLTTAKESSLNSLFNDLEASPTISRDESELNDLFDLPSATILEYTQEDDLSNFWDSETEVESEQILESVLEQDIVQALEESLFEAAASSDIFAESQQSVSSLRDLDTTFLQEEEQLDLIFSSDGDDDLFGELTTDDSSIGADIQSIEGSREISTPEIDSLSQQPEVLDFIPEFTTQAQELSSVAELEVDLFSEINNDTTALESQESLDLQQTEAVIELSYPTVEATIKVDLGDDLLTTDSGLSELRSELTDIIFAETNDSANQETVSYEESIEIDLGDDLLSTDSGLSELRSELTDIIFAETNDSANQETVSYEESIEIDLGDDLLSTDSGLSELRSELTDIIFAETNDSANQETVSYEESIEIDLGDDLLSTDSGLSELRSELTDIIFAETNDSANQETVSYEESIEIDLGDDLLSTDSGLSELRSELTDIIFAETNDWENQETVSYQESIEIDLGDELTDIIFAETDDSENQETVSYQESIEIDLGDELTDIIFAETDDSENQETVSYQESIELDLDDELTDIIFAETEDSENQETVSSRESIEIDLGDDLLITDSGLSELTSDLTDITFAETEDSENQETVSSRESIEIDLGGELTDIIFAETEDLENQETVSSRESIEIDLGDDLLITDSGLSELTSDLTDITFAETEDSENQETVSSRESIELDLGDDLLMIDSDLSELTLDEPITETHGLTDVAVEDISTSEFDELELMLSGDGAEATDFESAEAFADLSALLGDVTSVAEVVTKAEEDKELLVSLDTDIQDEFSDLEALLAVESTSSINNDAMATDDFAALEALLGEDNAEAPQEAQPVVAKVIQITPNTAPASPDLGDEFSDLEKLLAETDKTISHSSPIKANVSKTPRSSNRRARFEETMKVPVKQLDEMSNLVGELVVNRNTLEQDHERLRQSLDNLLIQVQQLSDVGARMQELYERSLLEASLLASRKTREVTYHHEPDANSDRGFSELEMDRFTPFHTLSQEMIELIVRVRESASDIDFVTEETERVARQFRQVTTQLQEGLTRARMVPFSQTIDRLRRGVRDNAIKFGKQVELVIEGGDTLIDKMILDHLNDPLTHMLNNAIAHGIETPEVRQAANKPPVGTITIRAFHQGNQTLISVGDDGAGIDTERIKAKAVKLGMMTPAQAKVMSRMEVYDLLFQAGFSIKDEADEIAGRGVGMDVVRSEISEIRGAVNTDSTLGKGTTFTIRLPLTLSICKALCCVSDKARIAFPMDGVEDTLDIPAKNVQHSPDGQSFISWRDTVLPFRPLKDLLTFNRQLSRGNVYGGTRDDDMISVVVVRSGNTLIALQIDLVLSEQEIVIKQFEGPSPKPIGVAGATVLGDGRIMPIADVLEIIDIFQGRMAKHSGNTLWQQGTPPVPVEIVPEKIDPTVLIVDDSITVRELLSLTFNKAGYRVEQARDGQEAWDKLRSGLPCDIVFCDIEMPRCDGLELLSRIQKDSNLNHLPIAMLT